MGEAGAARLAWLAMNPCDPQHAFANAPIEHIAEPDKNLIAEYTERRHTFKQLYQQLQNVFTPGEKT